MKEQYIRKDSGLYLYPEVDEPKVNYWGGLNEKDCSHIYEREEAYRTWKESRIEMSPELKVVTKDGDVLTERKDFVIIGGQRKRNHDGSTTRTEKIAIPIQQTKEAGEDYVANDNPHLKEAIEMLDRLRISYNSSETLEKKFYDIQQLIFKGMDYVRFK